MSPRRKLPHEAPEDVLRIRLDGEKLRTLRQARGLSQRQLAMAARMTQGTVSKIEIGLLEPMHSYAASLCEVLQVPLEELLAEPASRRPGA